MTLPTLYLSEQQAFELAESRTMREYLYCHMYEIFSRTNPMLRYGLPQFYLGQELKLQDSSTHLLVGRA